MKKILVTGGLGFLGSHLVDLILTTQPDVAITIVDDLSSNAVEANHYASFPNVTTFLMGVDEVGGDYDEIYHLASKVGPAGVLPHSGHIADSIINDAMIMAKHAQRSGGRLVFVSTSEIYGGGTSSEDDPKLVKAEVSPRLEYAVGKLAAEIALQNLAAGSLDVVIVRPFNIAGARQGAEGGFVLPRFAQQVLKNEPVTVFGDGNQVRAFTHVKDIAEGLLLAMQKGKTGEAYNLGNYDNRTTILDLAERTIRCYPDTSSKVEPINPKKIYGKTYAEAEDKLPNSTKANDDLGWLPKLNLDQIIVDVIKYEKGRLEK